MAIFKTPSSWKKKRNPEKTEKPFDPENDNIWDDLGVDERVTAWQLKRQRQELALINKKAEYFSKALAAAHDELDLMNLEAIKAGEGGVIPKRRK